MKGFLATLLVLISFTGMFSMPANSISLDDKIIDRDSYRNNFYLPAAYYYDINSRVQNLKLEGKGSAIIWVDTPITLLDSEQYYFLLSLEWDVRPNTKIRVAKALHIQSGKSEEIEISDFKINYSNEYTAFVTFKYAYNGAEQTFSSEVPILAIADSRYAEKLDLINSKLR